MQLTVTSDLGDEIDFECADTWVSKWVCEPILQGKTYPALPFVDDVQVVWDAGANCGATTVHLARHYPNAVVHAFEPATEPSEGASAIPAQAGEGDGEGDLEGDELGEGDELAAQYEAGTDIALMGLAAR